MTVQFLLPALNESSAQAVVSKILVAVGDTVAAGTAVLELETDKAVVEVPTDVGGKVTAIHVAEGQKIKSGAAILSVETEAAADMAAPAGSPAATPASAPSVATATAVELQEPAAPPVVAAPPAAVAPVPSVSDAPTPVQTQAPAAPSVRRFPREIGVDINMVTGTGEGGRISIEDVKAHAAQQRVAPAQTAPAAERPGNSERRPMSGVRRSTAQHLARAWAEIPHVTQFGKADVTELEELRRRYADSVAAAGGKLTVTAMLLKITSNVLEAFPLFNAAVDMDAAEIIYKEYINIGVAVDTPRGLLVPVIRDVNCKSLTELSIELGQVAEKARAGKLTPAEMQGGTFTISNLGGLGASFFTPIINAPEVAILGIGRAVTEPVHIDDAWQPRPMLPLALSYDHRVIDGADGARFMQRLIATITEPFTMVIGG